MADAQLRAMCSITLYTMPAALHPADSAGRQDAWALAVRARSIGLVGLVPFEGSTL